LGAQACDLIFQFANARLKLQNGLADICGWEQLGNMLGTIAVPGFDVE
jgi:hypothetical protein